MLGIDRYTAIVGLLSAFSSGRGPGQAQTLAEFQAWLSDHNHRELATTAGYNSGVASFIEAYLNRQLPHIQSKFDVLMSMVEVLIERGGVEGVSNGIGEHYAKNATIMFIGEAMAYPGSIDKPYIVAGIMHMLDLSMLQHDKNSLDAMVDDIVGRKHSAVAVTNEYWGRLILR
jgi:hypothetical protein